MNVTITTSIITKLPKVFLYFPDKPFIISDLKANTEYVMRVTSQNAAGPGDYGAEMKTKTLVSSATMLKINSNVILVAFTFLLINHFKC